MTTEELKSFVANYSRFPVTWFRGSEVKAAGGELNVPLMVKIGEYVSGRFQFQEVLLLDEEQPPDAVAGVFLHEMGHRVYTWHVARKDWNDVDSEVHAYLFGLSELVRLDMLVPLRIQVEDIELWLAHNAHESSVHAKAIGIVMQHEEWTKSKERLRGVT
jgi:hypothetical protein